MSDIEEHEFEDGTGGALVEFIRRLGRQGKMQANTSGAYASAAQKVLEIDENWASTDVRGLDIEEQLERFVTLRHRQYTAASLNTYKTRFSKSVLMYRAYLEDPVGFRAPRSERSSTTRTRKDEPTKSQAATSSPALDAASSQVAEVDGLVSFVYPLRPGSLVELRLPADMTSVETRRLAAFVATLATDDQPALPRSTEST